MEERSQLEHQIKLLQQQLDELRKVKSETEQKFHEAEKLACLLKEKKTWHEKQIADQNLAIAELKDEKRLLEDEKRMLNKELQEKTVELSVEREQAAVAAEMRALQSAVKPNNEEDKVILFMPCLLRFHNLSK